MADSSIFFRTQPLLPTDNHSSVPVARTTQSSAPDTFAQILAQTQQRGSKEVTFSQHAQQRLRDRSLTLSPSDLTKLNDTVDRMSAKGARESLIYLNQIALVVSVVNRTVITAMDGTSAKDNIFTNIDSAAIL